MTALVPVPVVARHCDEEPPSVPATSPPLSSTHGSNDVAPPAQSPKDTVHDAWATTRIQAAGRLDRIDEDVIGVDVEHILPVVSGGLCPHRPVDLYLAADQLRASWRESHDHGPSAHLIAPLVHARLV
jgi:hypothetical protein